MTITVEGPDGAIHEFPDGVSQDVIKGAMAKHYGSPTPAQASPSESPQDTSITGALARGTEGAASALGNLVSETGKHIGGGKTFPKWMAKVSQYLHDPNYRSGSEDAANPNADLGTRAAGVGRMMVEGAPGMALSGAAALAAGPAGFLGTQALLNSGNAVQGVREADKVPEDQALNPTQLARAGGAAIVDTALAGVGAGKALGPVTSLLGKEGAKKALLETVGAIKAGALAGGGQRVADSAIIEGKLPTMNEVAASAAAGGSAAGLVRGIRAIPEAGSAMALRSLEGIDPKYLAAAANETKQQSARIGPIKEGSAGSILDEARKATSSRRSVDAAGGQTKGPDIVQEAINSSSDPMLPYKYAEMVDDLKRGQPVNPEHITALEDALSGQHPNIDQWLEGIRKESVLNQVAQLGHREGGSITGGLHSTVPGRTIDNLARRYGLGTIAGSLALDLAGHGMMGGWGAKIGAGAVGLSGAMRGIDKLTGYSNPVGRFVDRFADQSGPTLPPSSTPVPINPAQAKAEARQADLAARAQARADAAAAKITAAKIAQTQKNTNETLNRLDALEASEAKAQAKAEALAIKEKKTETNDSLKSVLDQVKNLKINFLPQSQRLGRDMAEPASLPENPGYGSASSVNPADLAFNALLAKKTGVKDLNRITQFDNAELMDPAQVPIDDSMRARVQHFIQKQQEAKAENEYLKREVETEKAMKALGIDSSRLPTPDAPTFTRGDMTGAFPEPNILQPEMPPAAKAEPQSPYMSLIDQVTQGSAKRSTKRTPVEEAMAPPREEPTASPMASAVRDVESQTRRLGRGKWSVTANADKIRAVKEDGTPDWDRFFRGVEGKILQKEDFADKIKETLHDRHHGAVDKLLEEFTKSGGSRELALQTFDTFLKRLKLSKKTTEQLHETFKKSKLYTQRHWE